MLMGYLAIPTILYAIWRIYNNYRSNIKITSEISLFVGALVAFVGNTFFPDSQIAVICQLVLGFFISWYIIRKSWS